MKPKYNMFQIQTGMYSLGLAAKLTGAQFRFFWGLTMKAEELNYKPVLELTNSEAMALGGGESRQAVNKNRNAIAELLIDDEHILAVDPGDNRRNVCAKYTINYELLARYGCEPIASTKNGKSVDASDDAKGSTLRLDGWLRGKDHPTNPLNLTTEEFLEKTLPLSKQMEAGRLVELLGEEVIEKEIKLAEDERKLRADSDDPIRSFGAYLYTRLDNKQI